MKKETDNHCEESHSSCDGHHHAHAIENKKKLILVIFLNAIITLAEYIGGLLSGSLALISDAGHNLSDVLSLMLGYAGERVSERDATTRYTFGMKRFEVLIALINALSLIVIGIYIVYESVIRFLNPAPIDVTIMIPVALIGLLGNLLSILIIMKNKSSNLNMKAAFLHLLYDTISSVAVIAAGIALYFTRLQWIDLIISLAIVLMILWSSTGIIFESIRIFLQGTPRHIDTDEVYGGIAAIAGVGSIHGLHIWSINSSEIFLSCHICTDTSNGEVNTDGIIKKVNKMLEEKYGINHTTLQIENNMLCSMNTGRCCR